MLRKFCKFINILLIFKTKFHPLRDLQLQFKSEKYKTNKTTKILESKTSKLEIANYCFLWWRHSSGRVELIFIYTHIHVLPRTHTNFHEQLPSNFAGIVFQSKILVFHGDVTIVVGSSRFSFILIFTSCQGRIRIFINNYWVTLLESCSKAKSLFSIVTSQ